MAHTKLFDSLRRSMRLAHYCDAKGISTAEGMARRADAEARAYSRRQFLGGVGAVAATGVIGGAAAACSSGPVESQEPVGRLAQRLTHVGSLDVGIVGAGLAGL